MAWKEYKGTRFPGRDEYFHVNKHENLIFAKSPTNPVLTPVDTKPKHETRHRSQTGFAEKEKFISSDIQLFPPVQPPNQRLLSETSDFRNDQSGSKVFETDIC